MKMQATRPYRQKARAEAAEQTRHAIMVAAVDLWREQEWEKVTLGAIAERAGVTIQTVLRRFGSKDAIVDACIAERAAGVEEVRDRAEVGDAASALEALLTHYERDGDAMLRTLAIEDRSPAARRILEHGRSEHRAWCARVFAPHLPSPRAKSYQARLDAFLMATDIYVWKLLRRDLGRTPRQAQAAFAALLEALTSTRTKARPR
jgi:AcrR family transcriptional regulator